MATSVRELMPTVNIAGKMVSRLIIGGNPYSGNSHFSGSADADMRSFHSTRQLLEDLRRAEKWGVNVLQSRGDNHMIRLYLDHRNDGGGLQWWAQTASERADVFVNITQIAHSGATAIYHHGTRTDQLWQAGRIDDVVPYLDAIRQTGCLVGLGTHEPQVIVYAEEHGWDVDFYMGCLYNLSKAPRESAMVNPTASREERFDDSDRAVMLSTIRATSKPVLAFKAMGASRRSQTRADAEEALREALDGIKDSDAVVVGVFNKYGDQIAHNAQTVIRWAQERADRT